MPDKELDLRLYPLTLCFLLEILFVDGVEAVLHEKASNYICLNSDIGMSGIMSKDVRYHANASEFVYLFCIVL